MNELGNSFPLLTSILLLPVIAAACVAVLPNSNERMARIFGVGGATLTGLLSIFLLLAFDVDNGKMQFMSSHDWFPTFGIAWKLGVDGISLFLVVLAGVIFPLAMFYPHSSALVASQRAVAPQARKALVATAAQPLTSSVKSYMVWMLLLEASCIGSFLALDLFMFFIFFEAVLVPMYFLMAGWGFAERSRAALKFFLYTLAGSAPLFIGILAYVLITSFQTGMAPTFDFAILASQDVLTETQARWLFVAFAIAFAVKAPIFPFHSWLPDTYTQAPIAAVVVSAAVMVKMGTYGFVRFCLSLFPDATAYFAPVLLTLGVIGMIYGAIVAAVQVDLKRLVAFASLSHLGFIVLGTFALSEEGLSGAVLQMINHGISTAALFLLLGIIYARRSTTSISELRGLQKVAPMLAAVFTVVAMSSIGVPGLNGFVGEFLILTGTFITHRWWAVVGTLTVVLAAVYLLWAYQRVFHGEVDEKNSKVIDMNRSEVLVMFPLIALIVVLGVWPRPVLDRIEPSVDDIFQSIQPAQGAAHADSDLENSK